MHSWTPKCTSHDVCAHPVVKAFGLAGSMDLVDAEVARCLIRSCAVWVSQHGSAYRPLLPPILLPLCCRAHQTSAVINKNSISANIHTDEGCRDHYTHFLVITCVTQVLQSACPFLICQKICKGPLALALLLQVIDTCDTEICQCYSTLLAAVICVQQRSLGVAD